MPSGTNRAFPELTARQLQVLCLYAKGRSIKEIAVRLRVKPSTVGFHVNGILAKCGCASMVEAMAFYAAEPWRVKDRWATPTDLRSLYGRGRGLAPDEKPEGYDAPVGAA